MEAYPVFETSDTAPTNKICRRAQLAWAPTNETLSRMRELSLGTLFSKSAFEEAFSPSHVHVDGYKELARRQSEACRVQSIKVSHVLLYLWLTCLDQPPIPWQQYMWHLNALNPTSLSSPRLIWHVVRMCDMSLIPSVVCMCDMSLISLFVCVTWALLHCSYVWHDTSCSVSSFGVRCLIAYHRTDEPYS